MIDYSRFENIELSSDEEDNEIEVGIHIGQIAIDPTSAMKIAESIPSDVKKAMVDSLPSEVREMFNHVTNSFITKCALREIIFAIKFESLIKVVPQTEEEAHVLQEVTAECKSNTSDNVIMIVKERTQCLFCGKNALLIDMDTKEIMVRRCARCKKGVYCAKSCFKRHWAQHKLECAQHS